MAGTQTNQIQPFKRLREFRNLAATGWTEIDLTALGPVSGEPARSIYVPTDGAGEGRLVIEQDGTDVPLTGLAESESAMDGPFFFDKIKKTGVIPLSLAYVYDASPETYTDTTDDQNAGTGVAQTPPTETTSDLIYLGFDVPVTGVRYVSTVAGAGATVAVTIWTGSSFADPTDTEGTSALSVSGDITWAFNSSFAASVINATRPLFWVKIANSVVWSTNPEGYFQGLMTTDVDHIRVGW